MSDPAADDKSKSLLPDNLFWPEARAPSGPVSPPATELRPAPPAAEPPVLAANDDTIFHVVFDVVPDTIAVVPKGLAATPIETADGKVVLHLSGAIVGQADSSGRTNGFSIRVPDSFEAAASGKRVRVTARVRATQDADAAEFSLAYSTSEVGNSGWRKFTVGREFEPKGFEWDVPPMKKGNGDYVGILPAEASGVDVETLTVEAIPRG
jgi:hypothetical protein